MAPLQSQAALRRKLMAAVRAVRPQRARNGREMPRLLFLTDPGRIADPVAMAAFLPRGSGVIFRHFGAVDHETVGKRLATVCRRRGLVLLVAADPDLARRLLADGVHWPEARLRGVRPRHPLWIETASAHGPQGARGALRNRGLKIDALLVSTVFASPSPSAGPPMGATRFRQLTHRTALPVYALGGVTAATAGALIPSPGSRLAGFAAIDGIAQTFGG